jgi:hypothetical protein
VLTASDSPSKYDFETLQRCSPSLSQLVLRIVEHTIPKTAFICTQILQRYICSSIMLGIDLHSLPSKNTVTDIINLFKTRSLFYAHVFTLASDTRYKTHLASSVTETCKILTLIRFREKNDFIFIIK